MEKVAEAEQARVTGGFLAFQKNYKKKIKIRNSQQDLQGPFVPVKWIHLWMQTVSSDLKTCLDLLLYTNTRWQPEVLLNDQKSLSSPLENTHRLGWLKKIAQVVPKNPKCSHPSYNLSQDLIQTGTKPVWNKNTRAENIFGRFWWYTHAHTNNHTHARYSSCISTWLQDELPSALIQIKLPDRTLTSRKWHFSNTVYNESLVRKLLKQHSNVYNIRYSNLLTSLTKISPSKMKTLSGYVCCGCHTISSQKSIRPRENSHCRISVIFIHRDIRSDYEGLSSFLQLNSLMAHRTMRSQGGKWYPEGQHFTVKWILNRFLSFLTDFSGQQERTQSSLTTLETLIVYTWCGLALVLFIGEELQE